MTHFKYQFNTRVDPAVACPRPHTLWSCVQDISFGGWSSSRLMENLGPLIREDIFEKKSPSLFGKWQSRSFRLFKTCMLYSESKSWAPKPKQCIHLHEIKLVALESNGTPTGKEVMTITKNGGARKPYELRGDATAVIAWMKELRTLLGENVVLLDTSGAGGYPKNPSSASCSTPARLSIATLNFQYFSSYPKDREAGTARLREVLGGQDPPDFICVQEGLGSLDVLASVGFTQCICSAKEKLAQSVKDMVYSDKGALGVCPEQFHDELLCNQIYVRQDSEWEVIDQGAVKTSSALRLDGGGGRVEGELAIRSLVWAKASKKGANKQSAFVLNTHISGGRFEDQFFVQQLAEERYNQPDRIIKFFNDRPNPKADDIGILVGDFNATTNYEMNGPMSKYYQSSIANSQGVQMDAAAAGVQTDLEEHFKTYMLSPFHAIQDRHKWMLMYDQETVGATSGFGHLIDHMAISRPTKIVSVEKYFTTNQKFTSTKDTETPLTDHNCVKIVISTDPI